MRARGAERVVLAVPVGPPGTRERFATEFDEVVCLEEPEGFFGVGAFYADFSQTSDEEVIELLRAAWEAPEAASAGNPGNPTVDADSAVAERPIVIEAAPGVRLPGDLRVPESPAGLVLFAHGSGSSRLSPRNREVATALNEGRFATLLFDLLTEREAGDRGKVFDIELLAERLVAATRWAQREPELGELPLGYFGASTGAAAALAAAARLSGEVGALVSRGGRPDLAASYLGSVVSPTLLIVGGADLPVLELNERAALDLRCEVRLAVVPGAGHLFEEPGSLERVSALARTWFARHLRAPERELWAPR
jgi:putative phosphoribosyl transferase